MGKLCLYGGKKRLPEGGMGEICEHVKRRVGEDESVRGGEDEIFASLVMNEWEKTWERECI